MCLYAWICVGRGKTALLIYTVQSVQSASSSSLCPGCLVVDKIYVYMLMWMEKHMHFRKFNIRIQPNAMFELSMHVVCLIHAYSMDGSVNILVYFLSISGSSCIDAVIFGARKLLTISNNRIYTNFNEQNTHFRTSVGFNFIPFYYIDFPFDQFVRRILALKSTGISAQRK